MFPFHVDFSLPMWPLLSKPLYISMRRRKMYFFSTQSNKKSVNLGTLPVFNFYHQTPCENFAYLFVWKHGRIYMEKIWKSEEFVWNMWRMFKEKWKTIWKNVVFDWTSERNYMTKIWKSEEFVWKRAGFIEKCDEFPWKNDEFAWTSKRIYMVQRYSKYRFFDVNCILRYSKYCFSNSIPGRGNQNFNSIFCVGGGPFIYIYIYIHVVMSWDVLSVGVSTADWFCVMVSIKLCQ